MKIFIDLDDTLCNFTYSLLAVAGKEKEYNNITGRDFFPVFKDKIEFNQVWRVFRSIQGNIGIKMSLNATATIDLFISQGHELTFITDRDEELDKVQTLWWAKLKGWEDIPIIFSHGDKAKYVTKANVDIFIDDNVKHLKAIQAKGVYIIPYLSPSNKNEDLKYRDNWLDVYLDVIRYEGKLNE